jgi:hypothetical protein
VACALCFTLAGCDDAFTGDCHDTDEPRCDSMFTTCCDDDGCAFSSEGQVFPCDGFDCDQAGDDLAAFMCRDVLVGSVAADALDVSQDLSY